MRGTGFSQNLDAENTNLAWQPSSSWQNTQTKQLGVNYFEAFTVTAMAKDVVTLIRTLNLTKVYAYGLYSGSYLIHRVMQIEPGIFDAVVMDGVCAGKYCNGTDVDIFRDSMTREILTRYMALNNSEIKSQYGPSFDLVGRLEDTVQRISTTRPICGAWSTSIYNDLAFRLFIPSYRILIPMTLHRYTRCALYDVSDVYALMSGSRAPQSSFLHSYAMRYHILLSEFGHQLNMDAANDIVSKSVYPTGTITSLASVLQDGWKTYPHDPLQDSIATFTKPLLMLNGQYDPYSPLERAKQFAKHFTNSNQQLISFDGEYYSTIENTRTRSNFSTSCAYTLTLQFFLSPTSQLNTSCVSDTYGLSFDNTPISVQGDIWDDKYTVPHVTSEYIFRATYLSILIMLLFPLFVFLIVQRNKQPIKSRYIYPYSGLAYLLCTCGTGIAYLGFDMSGAFGQHLKIGDLFSTVFLHVFTVAYLSQMLRFITQRIMYRRMASSKSYNYPLLRILTSKRMVLVSMIIYGAFWAILCIIFYVLYTLYGTPWITNFMIAADGVLVVICILIFAIFVFDIEPVLKEMCKIRWKHFSLKQTLSSYDPLLFRQESLLVIPCIAAGVMNNLTMAREELRIVLGLFDSMQLLFFICVLLMSGGLVAIARLRYMIASFVRSKVVRNDDDSELFGPFIPVREMADMDLLLRALNHDHGMKLMKEYCEMEFSLENIICYNDLIDIIETYPTMTATEKQSTVAHFGRKYMESTSKYQVNIPSKCKSLFKAVQNGEDEEGTKMWRRMYTAVMTNIMDTFTRVKHLAKFDEILEEMMMDEQLKSEFE
jgi:pimeloyl-ACP methyl ester carboxylesterase